MWVCVIVPVCLGVLCTLCGGDPALDHHRHSNSNSNSKNNSSSSSSSNNKIRSSPETFGHLHQVSCKRDSDCTALHYCEHLSTPSVCAACRTERGRCHGDSACCSGLQCINDQCKRTRNKKKNPNMNRPPSSSEKIKRKKNFQEMENCVRSRDCAEGLCCGRYLTSKKCLRIPSEGEACSLPGHSKGRRAVEYCSCATGLSCHAQEPISSRNGVCRPSSGRKDDEQPTPQQGQDGLLE